MAKYYKTNDCPQCKTSVKEECTYHNMWSDAICYNCRRLNEYGSCKDGGCKQAAGGFGNGRCKEHSREVSAGHCNAMLGILGHL